jgi:hypothetical protein
MSRAHHELEAMGGRRALEQRCEEDRRRAFEAEYGSYRAERRRAERRKINQLNFDTFRANNWQDAYLKAGGRLTCSDWK